VSTSRQIYPARRAVEHATSITGIRPLRLFPVLWPLWQAETLASVYDEQPYEMIDRCLVRAVMEAGFYRIDELATFFGIPEALVRRCLKFLTTIGHIRQGGEIVTLTDLGRRSAQEGVRYVPKESRQEILIDKFTGQPLPRAYYQGSVPVFHSAEIPEDMLADRSRFVPLFARTTFRPEMVENIGQRTDRAELNLPRQLRDLRFKGERDAFLPAYIIETSGSDLLVYTALTAERDAFFENVCRRVPDIAHLISAEKQTEPREIWTAWLVDSQVGPGTLRQLPSGIWRAILRASAFGPDAKLSLSKVGSYELRKRHFLQVWCDDAELRRRALIERALAMTKASDVTTTADLQYRITTLARQLEVTEPGLTELREYASEHGMHAAAARLDALGIGQ
jgi:hypothetical protein